jgi:hypothetical protein
MINSGPDNDDLPLHTAGLYVKCRLRGATPVSKKQEGTKHGKVGRYTSYPVVPYSGVVGRHRSINSPVAPSAKRMTLGRLALHE